MANGSLCLASNLRAIHRATSLLLSNSKTNKLPMRLGRPSNLPPVTNCQRTSRLRDGFNHMTHGHLLCTSVTECISSRVRLLYAFPIEPKNEYFRTHCPPGRQSIRSSTFDHLRHPQCGGYIEEASIPLCSDRFIDINGSSSFQLYPNDYRVR